MKAIEWAAEHWYLIVIGILVLFLLGMDLRIDHLKLDLAQDKLTITELTNANEEYKRLTDLQNANIAALKAEADQRQREADAAVKAATAAAQSYYDEAAKIKNEKVIGSECQNLNRLLLQYTKGGVQ